MGTKPIRRVTFKKDVIILSLLTCLADNEYKNGIVLRLCIIRGVTQSIYVDVQTENSVKTGKRQSINRHDKFFLTR